MNGLDVIRDLSNLLEKGCDPNELAKKLDSSQLYECFEELVNHGLKATDEVGEKICSWPRNFILEDYVYTEFKTNYYVLDGDGLGRIHDETSLPLLEELSSCYDERDILYYALITIASRLDSILKCGFSEEVVANWFLESIGNLCEATIQYAVIENTREYNNFIKIMSCNEEYVKNVVYLFFCNGDFDPGYYLNRKHFYSDPSDFEWREERSRFNMFTKSIKAFIDAGIRNYFLIDCISSVCECSLAYYLFHGLGESEAEEVRNLLNIPIESVVTRDMYNDLEDDGAITSILSAIINCYGDEGLEEIAMLIADLSDDLRRIQKKR